jgi:hypothetical protein
LPVIIYLTRATVLIYDIYYPLLKYSLDIKSIGWSILLIYFILLLLLLTLILLVKPVPSAGDDYLARKAQAVR